jgi:hypothetical protein
MVILGSIFDFFGVDFIGYQGSALGDSDVLSMR